MRTKQGNYALNVIIKLIAPAPKERQKENFKQGN